MLFQVSKLKGRALSARDGDIGSVEDLYFDEEKWTIRYLVASTANWLFGRKVLVPRDALGAISAGADPLEVKLTKSQIENSPSIDTHKPISRQNETDLFDYYDDPYYWPGPNFAGPITFPIGLPERKPPMAEAEAREILAFQRKENAKEPHLRSVDEVIDYNIRAQDGELGHVADFVEDESWTIRYIVVDTRNWWPGKKVLIAPEWIRDFRQSDSLVVVDMSRQSIKSSPEYDPRIAPDREYEERLYQHHGRRKYWVS